MKRRRSASVTIADVIALTMRSQTRELARANKKTASLEAARSRMREFAARLGLTDLDAELPPIIHVAGTKGKGSTCAFVESILRSANLRTGLFTSPHLVDVRERIKVNGKMLSRESFEDHFLVTYEKLMSGLTTSPQVEDGIVTETQKKKKKDAEEDDDGEAATADFPGFFQFMTLMAFHLFSKSYVASGKGVPIDVLILETGIGGRLDATNAVDAPLACCITLLDLDHVEMLGNTLTLIAGEKAGIMKRGVPIVTTTSQREEGMTVLRRNAASVGVAEFRVVPPLTPHAFGKEETPVRLGLSGAHQWENAALAVDLARIAFAKFAVSEDLGRRAIREGLASATLPGRGQIEKDSENGATYYLDGAHTPVSIECATNTFRVDSSSSPKKKKILLFHCSADRDARALLTSIVRGMGDLRFDEAYFCPPSSGPPPIPSSKTPTFETIWGTGSAAGNEGEITVLNGPDAAIESPWHRVLARVWNHLSPTPSGERRAYVLSSLSALPRPRDADVFVTGSFYLVGDVLKNILKWSPDE